MKGKIKSLPSGKPYGFITAGDGGSDIFFHRDNLPPGFEVRIGDEVDFKPVPPTGEKRKAFLNSINGKPVPRTSRGGGGTAGAQAVAVAGGPDFKCPKDTREAVSYDHIDNFSLKLNRLARWDGDKFKLFKRDRKSVIFDIAGKEKFSGVPFNELAAREAANFAVLEGEGWAFKTLEFTPDWRMILGIGNESVYETGITLHHVYGVPHIPGQAIKGVTRSWIICELFGNDPKTGGLDLEHAEERALQNPAFCRIFGSPKMAGGGRKSAMGDYRGSVIFFDAFPVTAPKLKVDIMNPHYSSYYAGSSWPVDHLNPSPIPFLTVDNDSRYLMRLGVKPGRGMTLDEAGDQAFSGDFGLDGNSTLLETALAWCRSALLDHGIGAKTAVGYGYMYDAQ